jgi:hypothetical protein
MAHYFAVSADTKTTRKSQYAPFEVEAWDWRIIAGPCDTWNEAQIAGTAKIAALIKDGYDWHKAHVLNTNLKVMNAGRLKAYHIELTSKDFPQGDSTEKRPPIKPDEYIHD